MEKTILTGVEFQAKIQREAESNQLTGENIQVVQWQQQGEEGVAQPVDDNQMVDDNESDKNKEEDEAETPKYFFDQVNEMHGFDFNIEYPDDVDPDSPQGAYVRDTQLMDLARQSTIDELAQLYPDVYQLLLHRQAGGDLSNFNVSPQLPDVDSLAGNLTLQQSFYRDYLMQVKGLDKDEADVVVQKKITDKTLDEFTKRAHKDWSKQIGESESSLEEQIAQIEKHKSDSFGILTSYADKITSDNLTDVRIPDTKKQDAIKGLLDNVVYLDQRLMFQVQITDENITDLFQANYLLQNPQVVKELLNVKKEKQKVETIRDRYLDKQKNNVTTVDNVAKNDEYYRQIKQRPI